MTLKNVLKILLKPKFILWQFLSLLLQVFSVGLSVALPMMASNVLDQYFLQKSISNNIVIIIIVILVLILIIPPINSWLVSFIGENISVELKNSIINKVLKARPSEIFKMEQSKIYTIITNDVVVVKDAIVRIIPTILMSLILLVGSIFFMYRINPNVSLIIFIVIPIIASLVIIVFRKVAKLFKRAQEIRDQMNKTIDENIKASMLVRVFVSEKTESNKFENVNDASYKLGLEIVKKISLIFPILNITMYVGQLIVLLVGGIESINGRLSIGEISAFNNYVVMFTAPFLMLSFMSTVIGQAIASLTRINKIFSLKNQPHEKYPLIGKFQSLVFTDFSLTINDKKILRDINFKINRGEKIGIIGITGSGKTMFVDSILKFMDEYDGQILLNGKNISDVDFDSFRGKIGYVPQKNFILSESILNNVDFYRQVDSDSINKSISTALVDEFVNKYDDRLSHYAGEHGSNLSGGQKQRVTIARALAGNPEILILDDSTSKLDMATEGQIMQNLKRNYPDLTMIIVAQKIASIKDCDRIYVMENGTFEMNGTHEYLLENSFLYEEIDLTQSNYHEN